MRKIASRLLGRRVRRLLLRPLARAMLTFYRSGPAARKRMDCFIDCLLGFRPFTTMHPQQAGDWLYPELQTQPYHQADSFAWSAVLENGWTDIVAEYDALAHNNIFQQHQQTYLATNGRWDTFYLFSNGEIAPGAQEICPKTTALLLATKEILGAGRAYFSIMRPNTRVAPHCGPVNTRLRCHLPLHVPSDCGISVGGEIRDWTEGNCLIIDDSLEHSVWNESKESRAILLFDFWHPDLTRGERIVLQLLSVLTGFRRSYDANAFATQQQLVSFILASQR